jgi:hypothetical protein
MKNLEPHYSKTGEKLTIKVSETINQGFPGRFHLVLSFARLRAENRWIPGGRRLRLDTGLQMGIMRVVLSPNRAAPICFYGQLAAIMLIITSEHGDAQKRARQPSLFV